MPQKIDKDTSLENLVKVISLIIVVIGLRYHAYFYNLYQTLNNIVAFFKTPLGITYLIMIIGCMVFSTFISIKTYQLILYNYRESKERKREREKRVYDIEEILEQNPDKSDSIKSILLFIENLNNQLKLTNEHEYLKIYKNEILEKIEKTKNILKIIKKKELAEEEKRRLFQEQERIKQEAEEREREKEFEEEMQREKIVKKLDIKNNKIFKKESLYLEEVNFLKEQGFEQVNEYCPIELRNITVLVKKILNHSATHTFLVEKIAEMLQTVHGVSEIQIHETREADITFKYENKAYALEIETGSLLKQPKQLRAKVAYLNSRYKYRWLFVISNEKLYPAYRGFGSVSPRRWMRKSIEKMLKISTRF